MQTIRHCHLGTKTQKMLNQATKNSTRIKTFSPDGVNICQQEIKLSPIWNFQSSQTKQCKLLDNVELSTNKNEKHN